MKNVIFKIFELFRDNLKKKTNYLKVKVKSCENNIKLKLSHICQVIIICSR